MLKILIVVFSLVILLFIAFTQANQRSPSSTANMSLRRLPPLLFPAASRHTATVIFVHGLGDTGYGWADTVENWRRRSRLNEVKFILPHAPQIPITCVRFLLLPPSPPLLFYYEYGPGIEAKLKPSLRMAECVCLGGTT
jgi:hypothetical protein